MTKWGSYDEAWRFGGTPKQPPAAPAKPPAPAPTAPQPSQPMTLRPGGKPGFADLLPKHFLRGLEGEVENPPVQRWARERELHAEVWQYKPGRFFLGYSPEAGQPVARWDDRHVFLLAGSRAGKGVSVILPNATLWPGSMLAIDPKGELARKTRRTRERDLRQTVYALDPFKRTGKPSASFNPLAELYPPPDLFPEMTADELDAAAIDNAKLVADGLIITTSDTNTHWSDSARELLKGLILYTMTLPEKQRHLVTVWQLLSFMHPSLEPEEGETPTGALWRVLRECDGFDGAVEAVGRSFAVKPKDECASIISEATTQCAFLDSPALANTLRDSSFRLADLKRGKATVYLCLPAGRMGTHARWLRIIINMALQAFEETPGTPEHPVLMVLDEFNVLGQMKSISNAAGQIAGYGVKMLTVLQDITQIQHHYKETWETFIGNAGLFISFGNGDASSVKYISEKLGTVSYLIDTNSGMSATAAMQGGVGSKESYRSDPLLAPHEVEQGFARERERMLVMYAGAKPIVLQRSISHEDANFKTRLG